MNRISTYGHNEYRVQKPFFTEYGSPTLVSR